MVSLSCRDEARSCEGLGLGKGGSHPDLTNLVLVFVHPHDILARISGSRISPLAAPSL
jgi:hypothetical protein